MNILAFGASNSRQSINHKLALYAASLFKNAKVDTIDLNDYEMPLFGVDKEVPNNPPDKVLTFLKQISEHDLIIISLAEHNGSYSVAFKNVLDWVSRTNGKLFQDKPMLLLATSPGARGGASVLEAAKTRFPFLGANIRGTFSLPEFEKNFKENEGIVHPELKTKLFEIVNNIQL